MVLADQMRASKRLRIDGSEDEYEMEDVSAPLKDEWSFDDICGDGNFSEAEAEYQNGIWADLGDRVLARIFHFLRADLKSFAIVASTCKHWRYVLKYYKQVSRQVDFSSIASNCNDASLWNIMVILCSYKQVPCCDCFPCMHHTRTHSISVIPGVLWVGMCMGV